MVLCEKQLAGSGWWEMVLYQWMGGGGGQKNL
jgi:hypothetical protein